MVNVSLVPEYDPVSVAGVDAVTVPAVTVNVADVAPCGTVTVAGAEIAVDDELIATDAPPLGAAIVSAIEQDDVAWDATVTGLHEKPFRPCCWIVTVPPLADAVNALAFASAAVLFPSCTVDDVAFVELDTASATVAIAPFAIVVVFIPDTMHVAEPVPLLQVMDLLSVPSMVVAVTVAPVKSVVE